MIALLIAFGALAVGKIHGQDTVASFVINTQAAAVSHRRQIVFQEISRELQPPPPQQQPSFQDRDRSELLDRKNFSLSSRAITENGPRNRIIAVTRQPARMELPSNKTNESHRANTTNNTVRHNARQKEDLKEKMSPKQVQPVRPENKTTKDNTVLPKKPTVVLPTPTTNITLDERSNFDGDQCPTGYVRVNGKCVEAD